MKKVRATMPLLIEVGCEEIPARFLAEAQSAFHRGTVEALGANFLLPANALSARSFSTPRRLTVWVPEVLSCQPDRVEEILGPPAKVAFDSEQRPTRAAESFAAKNSVSVKQLIRVHTPKGEYAAVRQTVRGRPAERILAEIIPRQIQDLRFPKSMYWVTRDGPRFVRPIRWLLALLGEGKGAQIIPFEIARVKSGNRTYGHRAVGKTAIRVQGFADYVRKLRAKKVEIDPERRRNLISEGCEKLLKLSGAKIVKDKQLEDWLVNSTEWPSALLGNFEERFLRLPREILITVMRDHQKYFAVEDQKGKLQPRFVAVLNLERDRKGVIRQGHERVLRARFTDAEFFWAADQRRSLAERRDLLGAVTYEAELGSYREKVQRMLAVARDLGRELAGKISPEEMRHVLWAIELCKCDLTTHMVQEFPELQGIVGGLYGEAQGELPVINDAIYDHYLPQSPEDRCPRSIVGAVVSVVDKMDSVVGNFAVGREPTGSSDPYALRRQANSVLKVILEYELAISLSMLIDSCVSSLRFVSGMDDSRLLKFKRSNLDEFFQERLRYYLESGRGFRFDTVRAVLAAGWERPLDAVQRAEALEVIRGGGDFEALTIAAKRIKNILAKSASAHDWEPGPVDENAFAEEEEAALYQAYVEVEATAKDMAQRGRYQEAFAHIASLRGPVDKFFDKVLVMTEEAHLRRNRLRMLGKLDELFSRLAQFAEIVVQPADVGASTMVK